MTSHVPRIKTRLSLPAHRKVRGLLDGEYAAVQTGRSMDFNDLREYIRGDDVKDLDWKASARSRTLLVKRYAAVRKHSVLLAVSTGRSMAASNDAEVKKRDLAVFCAGLVGWLACRNGDLVGMVHGDAERQLTLPFASGELHLERALATAYDATTLEAGRSDVVAVLRAVARSVRRRTILLVVCDDDDGSPELAAALRRLVVQHEVLLVSVGDVDPTGVRRRDGASVDIDTGRALPAWLREDPALQAEYAAMVTAQDDRLRDVLESLGIVHERIHDEESAIRAVFRLLERHRHARRR